MNWILCLLLSVVLVYNYFTNKRCFLAPGFVVTAVMLLSAFIVAINTEYWNYEISFITLLVIVGSTLVFSFGQVVGDSFKITLKQSNRFELSVPSNFFYYAVILFGLATTALYAMEQIKNASLVGMANSLSNVVSANRYDNEGASRNLVIRLLLVCYRTLTYIVLIAFVRNRQYKDKRFPIIKSIIVFCLYGICSILTTNRADFIAMAATLIFLVLYFVYKRRNWKSSKVNKKLVFRVVLIFSLMLLVFRLLGYLTKKSEMNSFYDNICIYIGSSFVCLDQIIVNPSVLPADFEVQLFSGIVNLLQMVGIRFKETFGNWPHLYWEHGASNVYSGFFPILFKFGYLGLLLWNFFFGVMYGILWKKIRTSNISWFGIIIYADTFFYYLCMYSIAELFTSQFFTVTVFVELFFTWFVLKCFVKPKTDRRN